MWNSCIIVINIFMQFECEKLKWLCNVFIKLVCKNKNIFNETYFIYTIETLR